MNPVPAIIFMIRHTAGLRLSHCPTKPSVRPANPTAGMVAMMNSRPGPITWRAMGSVRVRQGGETGRSVAGKIISFRRKNRVYGGFVQYWPERELQHLHVLLSFIRSCFNRCHNLQGSAYANYTTRKVAYVAANFITACTGSQKLFDK